jgi:hypothetical protein
MELFAMRDRQLLGAANPLFIMFNAAGVVASFVFAWWWLSAPPNDISNVLNVGPALSTIVATFALAGTTRIVGDSSGRLDVFGYFMVWRIPVSRISSVVIEDGVRIVTDDGRQIGTSAYGYSSLADLLGYPRATTAAQRIRAFIDSSEVKQSIVGGDDSVQRSPRWSAIGGGVALGLLLLAVTLILNGTRS